MKADAQALKGHLDTLLLASLEGEPQHGYAVKEAPRQRGGDTDHVPPGIGGHVHRASDCSHHLTPREPFGRVERWY